VPLPIARHARHRMTRLSSLTRYQPGSLAVIVATGISALWPHVQETETVPAVSLTSAASQIRTLPGSRGKGSMSMFQDEVNWEKRYDKFLALSSWLNAALYAAPAAVVLAVCWYAHVNEKLWVPLLILYFIGAVAHL
jgi:hypothetical protein